MTARPDRIPDLIEHFIDGERRPSISGDTFDVAEPVGNSVYTRAAAGGPQDVEAAVGAARTAFRDGPWPRMSARERADILVRVADQIAARDEELARAESFDTGMPITQAHGQARRAAENFRFFADLIVAQHDEAYHVPGRQLNYVNRRPIGVAGLITPWNTPFMLESWKLAPALAAGCTVVLKPAEFTPLSADLWPEIFTEAGVPDGVFNLLHGLGEVAGDGLVRHPDVPLLSFTGESATGAAISGASAPMLKSLSMELGGKSPVIVFADADLDTALSSAVFGAFSLNGERCTAGSRVLVQRSIYPEFLEALADRVRGLVVGDPSDPETDVGPLVHPEHTAKVAGYVDLGRQEARLVTGGGRDGNFVQPTVFADVDPTASIFQDEIFGPVLCVTPFDTTEDAIRLANATRYGLAGYVWTRSLERAHEVAARVDSGMVWINSHNVRDLRTPFGGIKASGLGHEGGYRSLDFYNLHQTVHLTLGHPPAPAFGHRTGGSVAGSADDSQGGRAQGGRAEEVRH